LGISYPEIIHPCPPDKRDIVRIELNGARRQLAASQWKPLVDHLRSLRTSSGHKFSERSIAQAVGVDRAKIQREHPAKADGSGEPTATKTATKDGKVRNQNSDWTAIDRALHLIRQSTTGLTAPDLHKDDVLRGFGTSTISKLPTELH